MLHIPKNHSGLKVIETILSYTAAIMVFILDLLNRIITQQCPRGRIKASPCRPRVSDTTAQHTR